VNRSKPYDEPAFDELSDVVDTTGEPGWVFKIVTILIYVAAGILVGLSLGCASSSTVEVKITIQDRPAVEARVEKVDSTPWIIGGNATVVHAAMSADGATTATAADTTDKKAIQSLGLALFGGVGGYFAKGLLIP